MNREDPFHELTEAALVAKIRDAKDRAREAEREAKGWELILQGRRMVTGQEARPLDTSGERPGLTDAILRIMATDPAKEWPAGEIIQLLEEHDWMPEAAKPRNAVFATLSSMDGRRIERVDRGTYRLQLNSVGDRQQQLLDGERG
jgi:hypothetical protein